MTINYVTANEQNQSRNQNQINKLKEINACAVFLVVGNVILDVKIIKICINQMTKLKFETAPRYKTRSILQLCFKFN